MTAQLKYISSILRVFSTFLDSQNISHELAELATQSLIIFLQTKSNYAIWSVDEVNAFTIKRNIPFAQAELLKKFIRDYPPRETDIFLYEFLTQLTSEDKSESTLKNYRSDITQLFSVVNDTSLQTIFLPKNIRKFINHQIALGLKETSIRRKLASIEQFALFLEKQRILQDVSYWISDYDTLLSSPQQSRMENHQGHQKLLNTNDTQNVLKQYLAEIEKSGYSYSTLKNYRSDLNQFIESENNKEICELLTADTVSNFIEKQKKSGLMLSSIKRKFASISQFTLWAHRRNLISPVSVWLYRLQVSLFNEQSILPKYYQNNLQENATESHNKKVEVDQLELVHAFASKADKTLPEIKKQKSWHLPLPTIFKKDTEKSQVQLPSNYSKIREVLRDFSTQINSSKSKQVLPYMNLLLTLVFILGLGFLAYKQFIQDAPNSLAYPTSPVRPNRELSFQGRLTDTAQNPITTSTVMEFRLFDTGPGTGGTELWDTTDAGVCNVTPDQDGIFNVGLGDDCGNEITDDVFTENSNVWLEVTVAAETLTPRQSIKTVAYALNSETVQGYPISATGAATTNTILTMDSGGQILLGEMAPSLKATSGSFAIEAQTLTLQTSSGSNGNIILDPDGTGNILLNANTKVDGYLSAPGATLSATYAGGVPLTIKAGPSATGNITEWQSSTGTVLNVVDETGNLGIGTTNPGQKLHIAGGNAAVNFDYAFQAYMSTGAGPYDLAKIGSGNNVLLGNTTRETIIQGSNYVFLSAGGASRFVFYGTNMRSETDNVNTLGTSAYRFNAGYFGTGGVAIGSSATPPASGLTVSGNVGIGSTSPGEKLDIVGNLKLTGTTTLNSLTYTWPASQTSNYVLQTNGSGTLSWVDPAGAAASAIFWNQSNGALYPKNSTVDLLVGGQSTASAKFAFINNNSGTPTATISGNLSLQVPTGSNPATTFNVLNGGSLNIRTATTGQGDAGLTSRVYVQNNGNVGIGTTTPLAILHANRTVSSQAMPSIIGNSSFTVDGVAGAKLFTSDSWYAAYPGVVGTASSLSTPDVPAIGTYGSVGVVGISSSSTGGRTNIGMFGYGYIDSTLGGNSSNNASGGYFYGRLTANVTDFNGSLYGGRFRADSSLGTSTAGSVYGVHSTVVGDTNNTAYGGYFTVSGGTTNYGIYSAAGLNYFNGNVGIGSTTPRGNLDLGDDNAELHIGTSVKGYIGLGTQADYSSNWTNQAAIAINTAVLEGTGSSGINVRNSADSGWGSVYASTYVAYGGSLVAPAFGLSNQQVGIYFPSSAGVGLITNNLERLTVNTTGNVGIGSTTPNGLLQVSGAPTGKALTILNETGDQAIFVASDSGTNRFIIQGDGNVGIGTTTTNDKLTISGGMVAMPYVASTTLGYRTFLGNTEGALWGNYSIGAQYQDRMVLSSNWYKQSNGTNVTYANKYPAALFLGSRNDQATYKPFQFMVGDVNTEPTTTAMVIEYTGNVGVGTTTASYKLDLTGEFNLTDAIRVAGDAGASGYLLTSSAGGANTWTDPATLAGANYWRLNLGTVSPYNDTLDLLIGSNATSSAKFAFINVNSGTPTASISGNLAIAAPTGADPATTFNVLNGGTFNLTTSAGGNAGSTSRLFVANNGNVGIGTTNPIFKLQVDTTTASDGISLRSGGTELARLRNNSNTSGDLILLSSGSTKTFLTGSTNDSYFNNGGNLGINTSTPIAKLSVNGDIFANTATISATYAGGKGLVVKGGPSGTANIQEWQNGSGTALSIVDEAGWIGIGSTNPNTPLNITTSAGNSSSGALSVSYTSTYSGGSTQTAGAFSVQSMDSGSSAYTGLSGNAQTGSGSSYTNSALTGLQGSAVYQSTAGTLTNATGTTASIFNAGGGTITYGTGSNVNMYVSGGGNIAVAHGFRLQTVSDTGGGSFQTLYGVYLTALTAATSNNYGIWGEAGDWILDEDGDGAAGGTTGGGNIILGEGQDLELYHDGTNSYIMNNTGDLYIGNVATDDVILSNGGGNVGIGSTAPGYKLDVVGELNLTDAIRVAGDPGTSGYLLTSSAGGAMTWTDPATLGSGSSIWTNTLNVYHPKNEYASVVDLVIGGTSTASADIQLLSNGAAVFNEQGNAVDFRVESDADANALFINGTTNNVGVGTNTPGAKLDVNGSILLAGTGTIDTRAAGTLTIGGTTQTGLTVGRAGATTTVNGSGLTVGPTAWTATPTISGLITANSGVTLAANQDLTFTSGTGRYVQTFTNTTTNAFDITANSLTSGKAINISSSATAFTGNLIDVTLSGSNANNTGSLLSLTNSGTSNTNTALYLKHYATGTNNLALRVDDVSGDTTPFIIDGNGNVGIGTTSALAPLDVAGDIYLTSGLSTFRTAVSNGIVEATTFCTGDGETNCTSDFSALPTLSGWTDDGSTVRLTTAADYVAIGAATSHGKFGVTGARTGQALVVLDETGDQNIWTASASGATVAHLARTGYLTAERFVDLSTSNYYLDPAAASTSLLVAGNVGIGTTTAGQKLDVAGEIELANYLYFGNATTEYLRWDSSNFLLSDDLLPISDGANSLGSDSNRWDSLYVKGASIHIGDSGNDAIIGYSTGSNYLGFDPNADATSEVVITDDGNVGIGSTAPKGLLNVVGGAKGKALAILDETGDQAIFVASDSGTNRFIIQSDGNVGISTATPGYKLDVNGSSRFVSTMTIGTNGYLQYGSGRLDLISGSGGQLVLYTDSAERLRIGVTGNIGINDSSADARLEVLATTEQLRLTHTDNSVDSRFTVDSSGDLTIDNTGTKTIIADDLQITGNDLLDSGATSRITIGNNTTFTNSTVSFSGTTTIWASSLDTLNTNSSLTMGATSTLTLASNSTINGGVVANDDLTIQGTSNATRTSSYVLLQPTAGNVGIGTVTPTQALDINGKLRVRGDEISDSGDTTRISLGATTTLTNTTTTLSGTTTLTASSLATLTSSSSLSLGGATSLTFTADNATVYGSDASNGDITIHGTSNATRTSSYVLLQPTAGNVGIGTTTPAGVLDIQGPMTTDGSLSFQSILANNTTAYNSNPVSGQMFYNKYNASGTYAGMGGVTVGKENTTDGNYSSYLALHTRLNGNSIGERVRITSAGNLGIGTTTVSRTLHVEGSARITTSTAVTDTLTLCTDTNGDIEFKSGACTVSSMKYKQNVENLSYGLNEIREMNPVFFEYKDSVGIDLSGRTKRKVGFIAEEMQLVIPEVIIYQDGEVDGIDYAFLTSVLAKGIQELDTKVESIFTNLVANTASIADLSVQSLQIGSQTIEEYIVSVINNQNSNNGLVSPVVGDLIAESVTTENITATGSSTLGSLLAENVVVTNNITVEGNASISGTTTAQNITALGQLAAESASISGEIIAETVTAESIRVAVLEGRMAELENVRAQTAEFVNATVSGTLYANNIDGFDNKVAQAFEEPSLLELLQQSFSQENEQSSLDPLYDVVSQVGIDATTSADLKLTLAELQLNSEDIVLTGSAAFINDYLRVNGSAYVANTLAIGNSLLIGDGTYIADGVIEYSAPEGESQILAIQPSGTGTISLLAGLMELREDGQVIITGNLAVANDIKVSGSLLTNLLQPEDYGNPFQVQVAGLDTESNQITESRFEIVNELGTAVATISALGKAEFAGGIGVGSEYLGSNESDTVTANRTSGKAIVKANSNQIIIKSELIQDDSLIYVTPVGSTENKVLYVKSQTAENTQTPDKEGQFIVGFDESVTQDAQFNWWIVN